MRLRTTLAAGVIGALVFAAPAAAHVTVQPAELPANSFTRMDVRVPNELDDAGTVKVAVQFPDGFYSVSYEPVPGWDVKVQTEKLDEAVEIEPGFEVSEQVTQVTWTGNGEEGIVPPGAFQDFGLSVRTPDAEGDTLAFPSLQTYENGDVVRWIGPPDADEPAPEVVLTAAEDHHAAAEEEEDAAAEEEDAAAAEEEAAAVEDEADEDDGGSDGLAIAGVVLGGLGLVTGGTALARARRNGQ